MAKKCFNTFLVYVLSGLEFAGGYLTLLPTVTVIAVSLLFSKGVPSFLCLVWFFLNTSRPKQSFFMHSEKNAGSSSS